MPANLSPLAASYTVRVRGPNRLPAGQIANFRTLSLVLRYNYVSDWALELDADDPAASLLMLPGYGISVTRTVYNSVTGQVVASRVELSGPTTGISRQMAGNTLTIHGKDDLIFIASLLAWPVLTPPYGAAVASMPGILRSYTLTEPSGNFADSIGAHAVAAVGGITRTQPNIVDDEGASVLFDGTTGSLQGVGTGLPTGNGAWRISGWFIATGAPGTGTFGTIASWGGTGGTATTPWIGIDSSLRPQAGAYGGTGYITTNTTAITLNTPHFVMGVYDGTHFLIYVDGVLMSTVTAAGALAVVNTAGMMVGAAPAAGGAAQNFFKGDIQWVTAGNAVPTAAQVTNLYNLGVTRFAQSAYDTQTGPAETVIKHYVSANGGPSAGFTNRRISGLAIETDAASGATVTAPARFDKLIAVDGTGLLQVLAQAGGVGFKTTITSGALTFRVYVPVDRTGSIVFNAALGNVTDFTYTRDAPDPSSGGNVQIVGGSGDGAGRLFAIVRNDAGVTTWWRMETFLDARSVSDKPTLVQQGSTALAGSSEVDTFQSTLAPETLQTVYGVDFNLGDKVTTVADTIVFADLIREVDIDLKGNAAEVVVPKVGTPNAVLIQDATIKTLRVARLSSSAATQLKTSK